MIWNLSFMTAFSLFSFQYGPDSLRNMTGTQAVGLQQFVWPARLSEPIANAYQFNRHAAALNQAFTYSTSQPADALVFFAYDDGSRRGSAGYDAVFIQGLDRMDVDDLYRNAFAS